MEEWVPLQEFPGYSASDLGRIRNDKRGTLLTPVKQKLGYQYVGLIRDGQQVQRALGKLIAETFVPRPNGYVVFDTVIHLNGERRNCQALNLMWRPRWFALAFMHQFQIGLRELPPVHNLTTGEVTEDPRDLVVRDGILLNQIVRSILEKINVFPTMDRFDWA